MEYEIQPAIGLKVIYITGVLWQRLQPVQTMLHIQICMILCMEQPKGVACAHYYF